MRCFALAVVVTVLAVADDSGVMPRDHSSDYPVHQSLKSLSIGGVVLPSDQVKKLFSGEIASKYAVVEVGIYPEGLEIDVARDDFVLRVGDSTLVHPERPDEVALPWVERKPPLPGNTHVTMDTGVVCGTGTGTGPYGTGPYPTNPGDTSTNGSNYPANAGRTRGCGTYEGVGVSNRPTSTAPNPPGSSRDAVDIKVQNRALHDGKTSKPVAGFLYFQVSAKQRKGAALFLEYAKDGVKGELALPAVK